MNVTYIVTTYPFELKCTRLFGSLDEAMEYVRVQAENEVKATIEYDIEYPID